MRLGEKNEKEIYKIIINKAETLNSNSHASKYLVVALAFSIVLCVIFALLYIKAKREK